MFILVIFAVFSTGVAVAQQPFKDARWERLKSQYIKKKGGEWHYTLDEAQQIGTKLGINWDNSTFDVDQYRVVLEVELEHGLVTPVSNVTDDDPYLTGKIALAHLNEIPDYYFRLLKMESNAEGGTLGPKGDTD
jgi:hypothetical protein